MKNLWVYYTLVILPLLCLAALGFSEYTGGKVFVFGLLLYVLVYRPAIDFAKIKANKHMEDNKKWQVFIPFYGHFKYFKELYTR